MRKKYQEISKKIWEEPVVGRIGRPRLHWRDEVDEDGRMFAIKN